MSPMEDVKSHPVLNDVLVPRNRSSLSVAKIQNESCCTVEYDRILRESVLVMKGSVTQSRVQIPRESGVPASLQLPHSLVVLQIYLGSIDYFALEVVLSLSLLRLKLVIGTLFCKAEIDEPNNGCIFARMPLIIPRNRWVQVVIHVSGITTHLFNLPPVKCIVSISLSGACKASRLMTSNNEIKAINSTPPDMALFAVPAYAPPIWKSAALNCTSISGRGSPCMGEAVTSETSTCARLPIVSDANAEQKNRVDSRPSQTHSPKFDLPSITSSTCSAKLNLSSITRGSRTPSLGRVFSPAENNSPRNSATVTTHVKHRENFSVAVSSVAGSHISYMRLVDRRSPSRPPPPRYSNAATRARPPQVASKEVGNITTNIDAAAAVSPTDTWYGITRWEEAVDVMNGCCTTSTKVGSTQSSFGNKATGGGKSNNNIINSKPNVQVLDHPSPQSQRLKWLAESRKRHALCVSNKRPRRSRGIHDSVEGDGSLGGGGGREKKRGVNRRKSIRRRIKRLKEAQVSTRRMHELKKLTASELPIDPEEEALMMTEETLDVMTEPRCGYGFGYLGVLREGGEFDADEAADTKLKGALTLELSDEEEDEEDESENESSGDVGDRQE